MAIVKWGIIGCGDVTEIKSGPAFNKVKNSTLVAVMRRNAEKAKDYAKRHGVPKWYKDADKLINDPEVNAIYVATPPDSHLEYALKAIHAGKPVYIEKPVALNASQAKQIDKAVKKSKVKAVVAHYRRSQPLFKKIKQLIEEGTIGEVQFATLQLYKKRLEDKTPENMWRIDPDQSGGGLFHDLAPHQLDLMLYFFGDIKHARGIATNRGCAYEADDFVSGTILFASGVVFNGVWSFSVPPSEEKDYCEIIGSEGKISFSVFEGNSIQINKNGEVAQLVFDSIAHVQQPMIEDVVDYFSGNRNDSPCSTQTGVEVMQIIDSFTLK